MAAANRLANCPAKTMIGGMQRVGAINQLCQWTFARLGWIVIAVDRHELNMAIPKSPNPLLSSL